MKSSEECKTFEKKVGRTTFVVEVKAAEKGREGLEEKLKKLIKKESLQIEAGAA